MIYELRTYTAAPGKAAALKQRFRDHVIPGFKRHGIELVGCWEPVGQPDQFVYLTRFADAAASKAAWDNFAKDEDWQRAKAESEKAGRFLAGQSVVALLPTDFSGLLK